MAIQKRKKAVRRNKKASAFQKLRSHTNFNVKIALVAIVLFVTIGLYFLYTSRASTSPDIGVQVHAMWSDYDYSDVSHAKLKTVLDKVAAAKGKWVRLDMTWEGFEPTARGQIDQWYSGLADAAINEAQARGIKVIATVYKTPAWANGNAGGSHAPNDVNDYGSLMAKLATRYKGKVSAWEVWNEPNQEDFWAGKDPAKYTALLKNAYPRIKAADPNALVVFGGISTNDDKWIAQAYNAGAKSYFDVMATHPYMGPADAPPETPDNGETWTLAHTKTVRDLMEAQGDSNKPIWFTEFGWSSHANTTNLPSWQRGVTEAQQADYLTRALSYTKANFPYVQVAIWYTDKDYTNLDIQNNNYGLLRNDWSEKPAYNAFKSYNLSASTTVPAPTTTSTSTVTLSKVQIPINSAYWAYSVDGNNDNTQANFESISQRQMNGYHYFEKWSDNEQIPTQAIKDTAAKGQLPLVNWKPDVAWAQIANGSKDSYLDARADALKAWGKPILLAFHHEPEDDTATMGSAADYQAAYRRVVEHFRARGASNVSFTWVMMGYTFNSASGRNPNDWYPGDDVVDWLMADNYNFFKRDGKWRELQTVSQYFFDWANKNKPGSHTKPLGLAEWGSNEDPATPTRKAQWLKNASAYLKTVPNFKWSSYYSSIHDDKGVINDWRVNTSQASLNAWVEISKDSFWNPTFTSPDTTKPTVSITAPTSGSTVSGSSLAVNANASDNTAVSKVDFLVDNSLSLSDSSSPYTTSLNTTSLSNGNHTLTATAYDVAGNNASTTITVSVDNQVTTPPPPPVSVSTPSNFTLLSRNFVASTGFNLQWDPVASAASYKLYRNGTAIVPASVTKNSAGKLVAFDNSVKGLTGYTYSVTAVNSSGIESAQSASLYGRCDWFIAWFCR